jgi:hypothetical protein
MARTGRLVARVVSSAETARAVMDSTMVRLRGVRSAKTASRKAEKATPRVAALIVRLTAASDAWKTTASSGSNGWVQ